MKRIPTGIPGLDELLGGGFPERSTILLSGATGTGKTIFSLQFLLEGAKQGENTLYLSLDESREDILESITGFEWNLEKYLDKNLFIETPELYNFDSLLSYLEGTIASKEIKRFVFDSITTLGFFFETEYKLLRSVRQLIRLLESMNTNTIITAKIPEGSDKISSFGVEEFLVDGIIVLYYLKVGDEYYRALQVRKMRGTRHSSKLHPLQITRKGILVYPASRFI